MVFSIFPFQWEKRTEDGHRSTAEGPQIGGWKVNTERKKSKLLLGTETLGSRPLLIYRFIEILIPTCYSQENPGLGAAQKLQRARNLIRTCMLCIHLKLGARCRISILTEPIYCSLIPFTYSNQTWQNKLVVIYHSSCNYHRFAKKKQNKQKVNTLNATFTIWVKFVSSRYLNCLNICWYPIRFILSWNCENVHENSWTDALLFPLAIQHEY